MATKQTTKSTRPDTYKVSDVGIAIIYTSLPPNEPSDFIRTNFTDGIFGEYNKSIFSSLLRTNSDYSKESASLDKGELFNPTTYYTFGQYQGIHVMLMDDMDMITREFMPFSSKIKEKPKGFEYQIISGFHTYNKDKYALRNLALKSFLRKEAPYSFCLTAQLKLNSNLLIGTGVQLHLDAKRFIYAKIKAANGARHHDNRPPFAAIVLESLGHSELTVLICSDDYQRLSELVVEIREARLRDAYKSEIELKMEGGEDANEHQAVNDSLSLYTASLAYFVFQDSQADTSSPKEVINISENHLFDITYSQIGLSASVRFPENEHQKEKNREKEIYFRIQVHIKPGHIKKFCSFCKNQLNLDQLYFGKSDVLYINFSNIQELIDTMEHIYSTAKNEILRVSAVTGFPLKHELLNRLSDYTPDHHQLIQGKIAERIHIKKSMSKMCRENCRYLGISIVTSQRIASVISNFNNYLEDPLLFSNFLELSVFVKKTILQNTINKFKYQKSKINDQDLSLRRIEKLLQDALNIFEQAHKNRYFPSHATLELSDFILTHKSSTQQLITVCDALYKIISSPFYTSSSNVNVAYISGIPETLSHRQALQMNYFHVFQPSIFLSLAGHEALNSFIHNVIFECIDHLSTNKINRGGLLSKYDINPIDFLLKLKEVQGMLRPEQSDHPLSREYLYDEVDVQLNYKKLNQYTNRDIARDYIDTQYFLTRLSKQGIDESPKVHELLSSIQWPEMLDYFIKDIITYRTCYLSNPELFWNWHWGNFFQTTAFFTNPSKVISKDFFSAMFRMVSIMIIGNQREFLEVQRSKLPTAIVQEEWASVLDSCLHLFTRICALDKMKPWYEYFDNLAKKISKEVYKLPPIKEEDNYDLLIQNLISNKVDPIKAKLLNGEIIRYNDPVFTVRGQKKEEDKHNTFDKNKKVFLASYSYLDIIMGSILKVTHSDSSDKEITLFRPRDRDGALLETGIWKNGSMKFDPRGGIIIYAPELRKRYMTWRGAVLMSFWDISQIHKLEIFKEAMSLDNDSQ